MPKSDFYIEKLNGRKSSAGTMPVIALAGNPNTGKSTLFNHLTGLKQHTGNWPGKTVLLAEGIAETQAGTYRIIDLPGTYTLLAASAEEQVARDYICFGGPDATIVIADATALERNLSLALQVMEITKNVVLCVNLMDEAHRKGLTLNLVGLEKRLGIPVVGTSARSGEGISKLMATVAGVVDGHITPHPTLMNYSPNLEFHLRELEPQLAQQLGDKVNARWLALRILEGDQTAVEAVQKYVGGLDLGFLRAKEAVMA